MVCLPIKHLHYYKHYLHEKRTIKSFISTEQIKGILQLSQLIQNSSGSLLLANVNRMFAKQKKLNNFM